jgi:hypothetical protein
MQSRNALGLRDLPVLEALCSFILHYVLPPCGLLCKGRSVSSNPNMSLAATAFSSKRQFPQTYNNVLLAVTHSSVAMCQLQSLTQGKSLYTEVVVDATQAVIFS